MDYYFGRRLTSLSQPLNVLVRRRSSSRVHMVPIKPPLKKELRGLWDIISEVKEDYAKRKARGIGPYEDLPFGWDTESEVYLERALLSIRPRHHRGLLARERPLKEGEIPKWGGFGTWPVGGGVWGFLTRLKKAYDAKKLAKKNEKERAEMERLGIKPKEEGAEGDKGDEDEEDLDEEGDWEGEEGEEAEWEEVDEEGEEGETGEIGPDGLPIRKKKKIKKKKKKKKKKKDELTTYETTGAFACSCDPKKKRWKFLNKCWCLGGGKAPPTAWEREIQEQDILNKEMEALEVAIAKEEAKIQQMEEEIRRVREEEEEERQRERAARLSLLDSSTSLMEMSSSRYLDSFDDEDDDKKKKKKKKEKEKEKKKKAAEKGGGEKNAKSKKSRN